MLSEDSGDDGASVSRPIDAADDHFHERLNALNSGHVLHELKSLDWDPSVCAKELNHIKSAVSFWKHEEMQSDPNCLDGLFNFDSIQDRRWLKNLLLSDSSSDSDDEDISEEELRVLLKIHKRRRNYQKQYHFDILNSQYTYYSAGLLSEVDRFPAHQREVKESYEGVFDLDIAALERSLGLPEHCVSSTGQSAGDNLSGTAGTSNAEPLASPASNITAPSPYSVQPSPMGGGGGSYTPQPLQMTVHPLCSPVSPVPASAAHQGVSGAGVPSQTHNLPIHHVLDPLTVSPMSLPSQQQLLHTAETPTFTVATSSIPFTVPSSHQTSTNMLPPLISPHSTSQQVYQVVSVATSPVQGLGTEPEQQLILRPVTYSSRGFSSSGDRIVTAESRVTPSFEMVISCQPGLSTVMSSSSSGMQHHHQHHARPTSRLPPVSGQRSLPADNSASSGASVLYPNPVPSSSHHHTSHIYHHHQAPPPPHPGSPRHAAVQRSFSHNAPPPTSSGSSTASATPLLQTAMSSVPRSVPPSPVRSRRYEGGPSSQPSGWNAVGGQHQQIPAKQFPHQCARPYRNRLDWSSTKVEAWRKICEEDVSKLAVTCGDHVAEKRGLLSTDARRAMKTKRLDYGGQVAKPRPKIILRP